MIINQTKNLKTKKQTENGNMFFSKTTL